MYEMFGLVLLSAVIGASPFTLQTRAVSYPVIDRDSAIISHCCCRCAFDEMQDGWRSFWFRFDAKRVGPLSDF